MCTYISHTLRSRANLYGFARARIFHMCSACKFACVCVSLRWLRMCHIASHQCYHATHTFVYAV